MNYNICMCYSTSYVFGKEINKSLKREPFKENYEEEVRPHL